MINYELRKIKAIVFDVDGVLSLNTVAMNSEGVPVRTMNIKDGYAIQLAVKLGLKIALMTGGRNEEVRKRYAYLGVQDVFLNCNIKLNTWNAYLKENNLQTDEVIYVGDDIPDYEIMQRAGCACCPKDACADIKAISSYISDCNGGMGVARDIIEQVLRAQGKWLTSAKAFGW
ncbi:KdsC family phosphatase [Prevotella falsenii]|uniref:KdsC family phosphatase n=1 Tax=Prevotella falsenii TaxID=515414 RepID=UPI00046806DC|nr:HAD hydrolase family protein [Prevotella falsenii]